MINDFNNLTYCWIYNKIFAPNKPNLNRVKSECSNYVERNGYIFAYSAEDIYPGDDSLSRTGLVKIFNSIMDFNTSNRKVRKVLLVSDLIHLASSREVYSKIIQDLKNLDVSLEVSSPERLKKYSGGFPKFY